MKNLILILSLIIFTGSNLQAQEYVFGLKAGLNLSNMSSDDFSENNFRTGFHVGLLAEIPFRDKFSIQPELLYATQGTEAVVRMLGAHESRDYKLDYIQLPVLAKFYITDYFSLEAGPSFNLLVREEIGGNATEWGSSFELGGALGTSYKFRGGLFASARYIYGFTNALDRDVYDSTLNNNGFQFGVGYMF